MRALPSLMDYHSKSGQEWVCMSSASSFPIYLIHAHLPFFHVMKQQEDPHQMQTLDLGLPSLQKDEPNKILVFTIYLIYGILL